MNPVTSNICPRIRALISVNFVAIGHAQMGHDVQGTQRAPNWDAWVVSNRVLK